MAGKRERPKREKLNKLLTKRVSGLSKIEKKIFRESEATARSAEKKGFKDFAKKIRKTDARLIDMVTTFNRTGLLPKEIKKQIDTAAKRQAQKSIRRPKKK